MQSLNTFDHQYQYHPMTYLIRWLNLTNNNSVTLYSNMVMEQFSFIHRTNQLNLHKFCYASPTETVLAYIQHILMDKHCYNCQNDLIISGFHVSGGQRQPPAFSFQTWTATGFHCVILYSKTSPPSCGRSQVIFRQLQSLLTVLQNMSYSEALMGQEQFIVHQRTFTNALRDLS